MHAMQWSATLCLDFGQPRARTLVGAGDEEHGDLHLGWVPAYSLWPRPITMYGAREDDEGRPPYKSPNASKMGGLGGAVERNRARKC